MYQSMSKMNLLIPWRYQSLIMSGPVPFNPMINKCLTGMFACGQKCQANCGACVHCQTAKIYAALINLEANKASAEKAWLANLFAILTPLPDNVLSLMVRCPKDKMEHSLSQGPDPFDVEACFALCNSMVNHYVVNACHTPEHRKAYGEMVGKAATIVGQIIKALEPISGA